MLNNRQTSGGNKHLFHNICVEETGVRGYDVIIGCELNQEQYPLCAWYSWTIGFRVRLVGMHNSIGYYQAKIVSKLIYYQYDGDTQ